MFLIDEKDLKKPLKMHAFIILINIINFVLVVGEEEDDGPIDVPGKIHQIRFNEIVFALCLFVL